MIASDDDPTISQTLGDRDYRNVLDLLTQHYNLILVDTGTGILDNAIQGILREADQIVVVMPPALDGARVAAGTLDWLDQHGHADLVASAVAVINTTRGRSRWSSSTRSRATSPTAAPARSVPVGSGAGQRRRCRPRRPASSTRDAYLELANGRRWLHREPLESRCGR